MKKLAFLLVLGALPLISCGSEEYQELEQNAKSEYERHKENWPEYKKHWKEETDNWAKNAKKYGDSIDARRKAWERNIRKEEPKRDYIGTREDEKLAREQELDWEPINMVVKGASFNQVAEFLGEPYYKTFRGPLGIVWRYDALTNFCVKKAISCYIYFGPNGKVEYTEFFRLDLDLVDPAIQRR